MKPGAPRAAIGAILTAAGLAAACSFRPHEPRHFDPLPTPPAGDVESVVFLVGDAGDAEAGRSPLLAHLGGEVEAWSDSIGRDSAVAVLFLGDNVYPVGVRDRDHPDFPTDSAHLWSQVDVVAGPAALRHRTVGWFLAGNHDWGETVGEAGVARLRNQERQLSRARAGGPHVVLLPEAGDPGPATRDVGGLLRLVFLDTHWFLTRPGDDEIEAAYTRLADVLAAAGEREVVVAAHHPVLTWGPHRLRSADEALGYYWLLGRTGALVQDVNSPLYSALVRGFSDAVRAAGRRPLIHAAGHDHTLQVIEATSDADPVHQLVSGAGSKVEPVGHSEALSYSSTGPGYMTLVTLRDGTVLLFVTAGRADRLLCDDRDDACLREGVDAFATVYSAVLRTPE